VQPATARFRRRHSRCKSHLIISTTEGILVYDEWCGNSAHRPLGPGLRLSAFSENGVELPGYFMD
jgi:hypothetical protein